MIDLQRQQLSSQPVIDAHEQIMHTTPKTTEGASRSADYLGTPEPVNISTIFQPVQDGLKLAEKKMKAVDSTLFAPLSNALIDLIGSGGKRVRPALALLCSELNGPLKDPHIYQSSLAVAASVEMLHTASLVHDDVIDGALLRRGSPTLNAQWSGGSTVLAGNYMFGRAASLSAETGNMQIINIFTDTLNIMVRGELNQIHDRFNFGQPRDNYYQRIYAKTASLFCAATEPAAILAGFAPPAVAELRDFGYNLGMAFQIVDDILDFSGDEKTLGKPAGSDLRQGTLTVPFFYFLQRQPNPDKLIAQLKEKQELSYRQGEEVWFDTVDQLVEDIRKDDGIESARQEAYDFLKRAQDNLISLPDSVYRQSLIDLGTFVVQRTY